ncbi:MULTISPECIES: hypothetical protein [Bacillus subtilis group]|jgi:hypothetical protein|nr:MULTISPECIES: hypothetical protein [Bacillus subtilis group]EQM25205.1 hypothetical protein N399_24715 [Bacillus licheniformis CG-B52]MEC0392452.1 hypothetical protein [Bacillus subtilis]TWJ83515.1 hypothetical protein CHCC20495_0020 [Bacillus licheniformis]TWL17970.1 hypothetical protein CHCC19466_0158 [Bacillus licheniformis]TWL83224.1 hypothetical protein CHCC15291_0900 [Bacillus licheniformis]
MKKTALFSLLTISALLLLAAPSQDIAFSSKTIQIAERPIAI